MKSYIPARERDHLRSGKASESSSAANTHVAHVAGSTADFTADPAIIAGGVFS
jgi:hypothetical protein